MKVYVFGNLDFENDTLALKIAKSLEGKIENVKFVFIKPNEDLPFVEEESVVILDTIQGIDEVTVITEADLENLKVEKSVTAHDFDLGFQLKYLKKLGKLKTFTIIGISMNRKINIEEVKKLILDNIG